MQGAALAICRLCDRDSDLVQSHIIPRFVFRWLRESSVTGHMRFAENPNVRSQDGLKKRLLCNECETRISVWENLFAKEIFSPAHKETVKDPIYGKWMLKFAVSVSWRALQTYFEMGLNHFSPKQIEDAEEALETWKQFLRGERPHPDRFEQHMMGMDLVKSYRGFELPPNINRYLLRTVEIDVVTLNENQAFVYTKMCKLLLFGFIENENKGDWKGTKLRVNRGNLRSDKYQLPKWFNEHIVRRATTIHEIQEKMSQRQHDKIGEAYRKNIERFESSEMLKAIEQDYLLFGDKAFYTPENGDD